MTVITEATLPRGVCRLLCIYGEKHAPEGGVQQGSGRDRTRPYTDAPNPRVMNEPQPNLPAWRRTEGQRRHEEEPEWAQ